MTPSFAACPRRVIKSPSGKSILVLVRRNTGTDLRPQVGWTTHYDFWFWLLYRRTWGWISWLIRWDRTWLVELYFGVDLDPGGRPSPYADDAVAVADRAAANDLAEQACRHLERAGNSAHLLRQLAVEAHGR